MPTIPADSPAAVVAALGEGFTLRPCAFHAAHSFSIETPEGFRFSLLGPAHGRSSHYLVCGLYGSTVFAGDGPPQIRVAVSKAPELIARDIRRRFLPRFTALCQLAEARAAANTIEVAARFDLARTVCARLGSRFVGEIHNDPARRIDFADFEPARSLCLSFGLQITSTGHAKLTFSGDAAQLLAIADALSHLTNEQKACA